MPKIKDMHTIPINSHNVIPSTNGLRTSSLKRYN
jgi:hypothetical protein